MLSGVSRNFGMGKVGWGWGEPRPCRASPDWGGHPGDPQWTALGVTGLPDWGWGVEGLCGAPRPPGWGGIGLGSPQRDVLEGFEGSVRDWGSSAPHLRGILGDPTGLVVPSLPSWGVSGVEVGLGCPQHPILGRLGNLRGLPQHPAPWAIG